MRILITGGAGFIGSHLGERLLSEGNEVICLDNFFTGRRENVAHLLDHHNFELIRHDVTEPILLEVDQIYNLACPASPVHYQYNPVKTVKTSVMGIYCILSCSTVFIALKKVCLIKLCCFRDTINLSCKL